MLKNEGLINDVKKCLFSPKEVIFCENVVNVDKLIKSKTTQIISPNDDVAVMQDNGCLILDFGKELYGNLRILLGQKDCDCPLHITLGESVAESVYAVGEFGACNDHSVHEIMISPSAYSDLTTPKTGFRFAKIAIEKGNCDIISVFAESELPNLNRKGYFRSDDKLINTIAETAADTATLCVQNDFIWDGIKRDRMVWIGDLHPEMLTLAQLYGVIPQMKNCLSCVKQYVPHSWVNLHPAYSAWWIICLADYYMLSGDVGFVSEYLPFLDKILLSFNNVVEVDGSISFAKSREKVYQDAEFFFDWPTNFKEERIIGVTALLKIAMKKALWLQDKFSIADKYANSINERLNKRVLPHCKFKQVEAFNYFSGGDASIAKEVLADGGSNGMTCFMGLYILTAAAECGLDNQVLSIIKDFYGGMLSLGATTFWEDFDVEWLTDKPQGLDEMPDENRKNIHRDYGKFCYKGLRHSLCHGWASGVYAFFIRTVLGIVPVDIGYKKIKISPHLIGLKSVEGRVPTPYGDIYVKHTLSGGKINTRIKKPNEIEIVNDI